MTDKDNYIGLSQAIAALRAELAKAQIEAASENILFPLEKLTVELKVVATKSADGKAGFKVPLIGLEIGGAAGLKSETVQTITVLFGAPTDRQGSPLKISNTTNQRKD